VHHSETASLRLICYNFNLWSGKARIGDYCLSPDTRITITSSILIVREKHQLWANFLVEFISSQEAKRNRRLFQRRSFFVRFLCTFRDIYVTRQF